MSSQDNAPGMDSVPPAVRTRTFRIDDEMWAAVERYAAAQDLSAAEYVRRAVLAMLAQDRETAAFASSGADDEQVHRALLVLILSRAAADVQLVARAMGEQPPTSPED